jgi:hypothetical protein
MVTTFLLYTYYIEDIKLRNYKINNIYLMGLVKINSFIYNNTKMNCSVSIVFS